MPSNAVKSHGPPGPLCQSREGPSKDDTLEETKRGAKNRANAARRAAMHDDDRRGPLLGIGIESGLFALDGKHLDVCVVAAYDGQRHCHACFNPGEGRPDTITR